MANSDESLPRSTTTRPRRRGGAWTIRLTPRGAFIVLMVNLIVLAAAGAILGKIFSRSIAQSLPTPSVLAIEPIKSTDTPTLSPEVIPTIYISETPLPQPVTLSETAIPINASGGLLQEGLILLALDEGSSTHLFAYQPVLGESTQPLPLTRLTDGPWEDIQPMLSPDGGRVAFASNRNGYWDIYLLELSSGLVTRVTDSLEYDGAPSWSPDGRWLVYETYIDDNLELMIRSVLEEVEPIRLTNDPGADHSPAWSPQGRQIAFVSTRGGESDIWMADLDQTEDGRFLNISQNSFGADAHPAWSPDGNRLAWAGLVDGNHNIYVQDKGSFSQALDEAARRLVGSGDWPVWSLDGKAILSLVNEPNLTYLTVYESETPGLVIPALELPVQPDGLTWGTATLPLPLLDPYKSAALLTPTPLWALSVTVQAEDNGGRYQLIPLADVQAPYPLLHDLVDESFMALRDRLAEAIGWDFLVTLENAYVPLSDPLDPGRGDDWLYTGRAFAFNTLPLNAGWIAVIREDFGIQTYWRVYVRTVAQDGSKGKPLRELSWDLNARFDGDSWVYEQGGKLVEAPPAGYWYDLTAIAHGFGWERIPALSTWRAAYPSTRYNEFVFGSGLDWESAILQLYPPEVLITPSPIIPPTITPSPTPRWYQSPTPSSTSTPRPTFTPVSPTPTDTATPKATPTRTRIPTRTPTPATATPVTTIAALEPPIFYSINKP